MADSSSVSDSLKHEPTIKPALDSKVVDVAAHLTAGKEIVLEQGEATRIRFALLPLLTTHSEAHYLG